MRIILARHGQTNWNIEKRWQGNQDIRLNDRGIKQAQMLCKRVEDFQIDRIYTSPLLRAKKTAEIVNTKLNIELIIDNDLREISFGDWEGHTLYELEEKFPEDFKKWDAIENANVGFGVESYGHLQNRAYETLRKISCIKAETILIITHGTWIRALICKLMDIPIDNKRCFEISNCGLTILDFDEKTEVFKIVSLNNI